MGESRFHIVYDSARPPLSAKADLAVGPHHTLAPASCESHGVTQYTVVPLPLLERKFSVPWALGSLLPPPSFVIHCFTRHTAEPLPPLKAKFSVLWVLATHLLAASVVQHGSTEYTFCALTSLVSSGSLTHSSASFM